MKEYLRGVIWPREPADGKYRYVVVAMLVTDKPLEGIEGKNELVVDGQVFGLSDILESVRKRKPNIQLGDATDVLLNLEHL